MGRSGLCSRLKAVKHTPQQAPIGDMAQGSVESSHGPHEDDTWVQRRIAEHLTRLSCAYTYKDTAGVLLEAKVLSMPRLLCGNDQKGTQRWGGSRARQLRSASGDQWSSEAREQVS